MKRTGNGHLPWGKGILLSLSHACSHLGLGGVRAIVQLEEELSHPGAQLRRLLLQDRKELVRSGDLNPAGDTQTVMSQGRSL